jgi:transposase
MGRSVEDLAREFEPLLSASVADRPNWTLACLAREIESREGVAISRSLLSKVLRKKGGSAGEGRGTR